MADNREPQNQLAVRLYARLLPLIQTQDQKSGAQGYISHWDDAAPWDSGDPTDVWDAFGASPIIQELFYVLETLEGEDVQVLESLLDLVDPLKCPVELLPDIAASLGYKLADSLDEAARRVALIGLFDAYKSRGRRISFDVFFRLLGFRVFKISPLWKKDIHEENNDYSETQWETAPIVGAPVGPAGNVTYTGRFADTPIRPTSLRITDTSDVIRDDGRGGLLGPSIESGTINYESGDYVVSFAAAAVGAVTADFDQITEEWPYHAARIDLELEVNPLGGAPPLIDLEFAKSLLSRIEEVRPIHVLVRKLGIIVALDDTMAPVATDQVACVTEARDDRAVIRTRDLLDLATTSEDAAIVEEIVGGITTKMQVLFEEPTVAICPLDMLIITAGGPDIYV
jgi:hypothetical protein